MNARMFSLSATIVLACALVQVGQAEIISTTGSTEAVVQEVVDGHNGDRVETFDAFPATSSELPLQVLARLLASEPYIAGGDVAAQFADPAALPQPNPAEFALYIALNSVTDGVNYFGRARTGELRGIRFRPAELGSPPEDAVVTVAGRLFLDGVMAVYGNPADRDLTGVFASLKVTVVKQVAGMNDVTVFAGIVDLNGGPNGSAVVNTDGQFPRQPLIITNLSAFVPDFGAFHLLTVPNITINYNYNTLVSEEFTLRATVELEAGNIPHESGVIAIIGLPVFSVQQALADTLGSLPADNMLKAIQKELDSPTGSPAFPDAQLSPTLLPGVCGLFGVEMLVGLALLTGLTAVGTSRFRPRA